MVSQSLVFLSKINFNLFILLDWEKVDHSVLLVGWGEEEGEKFW